MAAPASGSSDENALFLNSALLKGRETGHCTAGPEIVIGSRSNGPRDEAEPSWLAALETAAAYPHSIDSVERMETHLSWVFLTGEWVYKLKKPLHLPFVDFSTLEKRSAACLEELRLNRRTAAAIYDRVVPLTKTAAGPRFDGDGDVLEFAVRMRQFSQSNLLLEMVQDGRLTAAVIDQLGRSIAQMHSEAAAARSDSPFGTPAVICRQTAECFPVLRNSRLSASSRESVDEMCLKMEREGLQLTLQFESRHGSGFVRECHGDLHLGNLVMVEGNPRPFDCLEFNEELRWIDVVSDVAFTVMDLLDHGLPEMAWRLFDGWLEWTGDFRGAPLLRYYLAYRALVRAKVAGIRLTQPDLAPAEIDSGNQALKTYLSLAEFLMQRRRGGLVLMHGLSGSGKSVAAQRIVESTGAIRLRSDVERKRLAGLWPEPADFRPQHADGLYSAHSTTRTYNHLFSTAGLLLSEGLLVVVDATFLEQIERARFEQLADKLHLPWAIVDCRASDEVLKDRVRRRAETSSDPSDATPDVIDSQRSRQSPLSERERRRTVECWTEREGGLGSLRDGLAKLIPLGDGVAPIRS